MNDRLLHHPISASVADWSREVKPRWAWMPGKSLLASIRSYQRHRGSNNPLRIAACKVAVLRHRFWSAVSGADIPLNCQPRFFPVNGDLAASWILAAQEQGTGAAMALTGAIGRAIWAQERDIASESTLVAIAEELRLDPAALARRAATPEILARYKALTQEAIERKVFGAPTYIYRDELFWGQDRLDFLDRALAK